MLEIYNEKVLDWLQSNNELTLAKGTGEWKYTSMNCSDMELKQRITYSWKVYRSDIDIKHRKYKLYTSSDIWDGWLIVHIFVCPVRE